MKTPPTDSPAPLLLLAYQCGPGLGSVSQIGWQWFSGMAARRPTTLLTHVRNRAAIEAEGPPPSGSEVLYIDTEWFAGPLYRLAKRCFPRSEHAVFMLSQLDWFLFDALALRRLRQLRRDGARWRLLHLVTPVTVSAPTRLHRLGLPVLRGPLNCGLQTPPGFEQVLQEDALGLARLRLLPRFLEACLGSLRHSRAVLVATAATRAALPSSVRERSLPILENAIDPHRFEAARPAEASQRINPADPHSAPILRVCFVGRLVAVKALGLLLQAQARLLQQNIPISLEVVGDGPMRATWQAQAESHGLSRWVRWRGALGAEAVVEAMQRCQVFCLPSVRESGGAVLLEAMACGRPVIGMNFGGPAEIVDAEVGWRIEMGSEAEAVTGLCAALEEAQAHPEEAAARGARARERVLAQHTWQARLDAAETLYAQLLAQPQPAQPALKDADRCAAPSVAGLAANDSRAAKARR
ncbi:glycosyltransferase [Paucibacter sp. AS339]|uniref:glycosyltransferase n=1 Tax=Paucibacter hankyongi TaxID=3133434 RepID=UPI00309CA5D8